MSKVNKLLDANVYAEKLELVYREYERSLDLEVAFAIVPLSEEEKSRLTRDEELAARIAVYDAKYKTEMVESLRHLSMNAESEGVKLSALKELGKTFYPKRFKDSDVSINIFYKVIRRVQQDAEVEAS
jgi:hypothetical protein